MMANSFLHISRVNDHIISSDFSKIDMLYEKSNLRSIFDSLLKLDELVEGKNVLIKPNWVRHSINVNDKWCLRTNDNFTLAVLERILRCKPRSVIIGDAPIQGCDWNRMISSNFIGEVFRLSSFFNIPVSVRDFRRRIFNINKRQLNTEVKTVSDYFIFDIGSKSYLDPITPKNKNRFRVTDYDPERMNDAHGPGIHKYCIIKELLESDIVISLPKIKTHQKTGITGALKNLVGINGDKDFLPHHRMGGTKLGGDCYPGGSYLRYFSELILDQANRNMDNVSYKFYKKLSSLLWRLSIPDPVHNIDAGWYGNDTTWRMVIDLNIIAEFGTVEGNLSKIRQRHIYSICDGIIAGQGDGPLNPEPLNLGIITFSNNSFINDVAVALLMGLPFQKIPLLSFQNISYDDCEIKFNGKVTRFEDLKDFAIETKLPKGWIRQLS